MHKGGIARRDRWREAKEVTPLIKGAKGLGLAYLAGVGRPTIRMRRMVEIEFAT